MIVLVNANVDFEIVVDFEVNVDSVDVNADGASTPKSVVVVGAWSSGNTGEQKKRSQPKRKRHDNKTSK